ncbi:MAG TPA: ABC transporter permease [Ilumatobacter sp.]|nr:ABC transporter permease [Ilumatobacter sp.]
MTIEAMPVTGAPTELADDARSARRAERQATLARRVHELAVPVVGTLVLAAIVELLVRGGVIDRRLMSPPTEIVRTLADEMRGGRFWQALGNSLRGWAMGLGLAIVVAVPAGVVIGANDWVFRSVRFLIDFVRPIPSIALLPLMMLVVGIQPALRTYMVAIAAVWPMLFQTMYGVQDVDPVVRDMARSYRIGPIRRFFSVSLPGAAPFIATGLRLSVSVALLLTVGTEMVVGMPGLGREIISAQYAGQLDRMYALVSASGLLGMLITAIFTRVERRALRWHPSQRKEVAR